MKISAMTIRPNSSIVIQRVEDDRMLKFLQEEVDGFFEKVHLDGRYSMFINEDGLRLNLSFNRIASAMVNGGSMTLIDPSSHPYITGAIVGSAVVLGEPTPQGDETDVPPLVIVRALKIMAQR